MGNAQLQRTYGHVLVLSSRRLVRPAVDDDFEYGKRSQKKKKKKKEEKSFILLQGDNWQMLHSL